MNTHFCNVTPKQSHAFFLLEYNRIIPATYWMDGNYISANAATRTIAVNVVITSLLLKTHNVERMAYPDAMTQSIYPVKIILVVPLILQR